VPLAVWFGLIFVLFALTFGGVRLFRSARSLWRDLRSFLSTLDGTLSQLNTSAEALAQRSARFGAGFPRLEVVLTRFRASRARLAVLRAAVEDAQDSVGRVTAVYPRK
jgi:hypothetical protein